MHDRLATTTSSNSSSSSSSSEDKIVPASKPLSAEVICTKGIMVRLTELSIREPVVYSFEKERDELFGPEDVASLKDCVKYLIETQKELQKIQLRWMRKKFPGVGFPQQSLFYSFPQQSPFYVDRAQLKAVFYGPLFDPVNKNTLFQIIISDTIVITDKNGALTPVEQASFCKRLSDLGLKSTVGDLKNLSPVTSIATSLSQYECTITVVSVDKVTVVARNAKFICDVSPVTTIRNLKACIAEHENAIGNNCSVNDMTFFFGERGKVLRDDVPMGKIHQAAGVMARIDEIEKKYEALRQPLMSQSTLRFLRSRPLASELKNLEDNLGVRLHLRS